MRPVFSRFCAINIKRVEKKYFHYTSENYCLCLFILKISHAVLISGSLFVKFRFEQETTTLVDLVFSTHAENRSDHYCKQMSGD